MIRVESPPRTIFSIFQQKKKQEYELSALLKEVCGLHFIQVKYEQIVKSQPEMLHSKFPTKSSSKWNPQVTANCFQLFQYVIPYQLHWYASMWYKLVVLEHKDSMGARRVE